MLEYGVDFKICNKEGKNVEEYIFEDERFCVSLFCGLVYVDSLNSLYISEVG